MSKMAFNSNILDRLFKKTEDVFWDLSSGNISVRTEDGLMSYSLPTDENQNGKVICNMMDSMGIAIPAFCQDTNAKMLESGDLIFKGGKPFGWVVKGNEQKSEFVIHTVNGSVVTWCPPEVTLGIGSGNMVLKSLVSAVGGKDNMKGFSSMLMPMMMLSSNESDDKFDKIIPFMLMQANNGGGFDSNMMMMLMMMGGGNKGFF